jgi:hypothetical protein
LHAPTPTRGGNRISDFKSKQVIFFCNSLISKRLPEFRKHGWQIGSGPTESQCKLCTKRLKGYGRRWDRPNAAAVAALDSLDRNGQWHQIWPNARSVTT